MADKKQGSEDLDLTDELLAIDKVKQAGNAVTPPAARDLGHAVAEFLLSVAA